MRMRSFVLALCLVAATVSLSRSQGTFPGVVPTGGQFNIRTFGAIGDGASHPLSSIYSTLARAQAVYPFVSDLTQEIDWAATQLAIDTGFAHNSASAYCPAVPNSGGAYRLSLPIFIDKPGNARGSNPAWAVGTTYANGATVNYNGVPWASNGSGNVGNPPTATNGYPANIGIAGLATPFANVQISNASPAVVTLTAHGLTAGMPLIFLPQTYTIPGGSAPALPTGINANQVYYVLAAGLAANTFEISATRGGSAINTSSAGVGTFTASTQVWQVSPNASTTFSDRSNLIGDPGLPSSQGCIFAPLSPTSVGMYVGPNNGNLIQNITLFGPGGSQRNFNYRCQMWNGGNAFAGATLGAVGIFVLSNGGGASRTKFKEVQVSGFYTAIQTGVGATPLDDSNTIEKSVMSDSCVGVSFDSTESFINSIYESNIQQNDIGVLAKNGGGVTAIGGNYSNFLNIDAGFAYTGATTADGVNYTLTITSPDAFLLWPMCGYNLQCGYNAFTIKAPHWGVAPFEITGFNPITGVMNLVADLTWRSQWGASPATGFDIPANGTLYADEMGIVFDGIGIEARGQHFEPDGAPIQVLKTDFGFGTTRPNRLVNEYFNSVIPPAFNYPLNPSTTQLARQYTQDVFPFISADGTDVYLDAWAGALGTSSQNRVVIQKTGGGYFRFTGQMPYNFNITGMPPGQSNPYLNNSGSYSKDATAFTGGGTFDSGQISLSTALAAQWEQDFTDPWGRFDYADFWRGYGWGNSEFWGFKPAPNANPCIRPADVTSLGSLPAITYVSRIGDNVGKTFIVSGGTGYQVGDVLTLVGGTGTAAQFTVLAVSGGVVTQINTGFPTTLGAYTVEPPAGTLTTTGGHGTGATLNVPSSAWQVSYHISYPLMYGGVTYRVCDINLSSQTHYAYMSTNLGWSYFQNLTTTNVPNLSWTGNDGVPVIFMNNEALELMFPGLVITLSGTGPCAGHTNTMVVMGVFPDLGYITALNTTGGGGRFTPVWGINNCTGTTIGQAAPNLVNPF